MSESGSMSATGQRHDAQTGTRTACDLKWLLRHLLLESASCSRSTHAALAAVFERVCPGCVRHYAAQDCLQANTMTD